MLVARNLSEIENWSIVTGSSHCTVIDFAGVENLDTGAVIFLLVLKQDLA